MLWIFKAARWTRDTDRCTKINKSLTVSSGIRTSSFEIWTANLAQSLTLGTLTNSRSFIFGVSNWKFCKFSYSIGAPKHNIQMQIFLYFFLLPLFLCEKNTNLLDNIYYIQERCIRKRGKIWSEPKLLFGVYYWFLKLYPGIIWQLLSFTWDFVAKGQQLVWGQVG